MGRAILEILLAVLLAAAATLALVWGLENKALKQDLNKAIAALKTYKAKVEELETEVATKEAELAKAPPVGESASAPAASPTSAAATATPAAAATAGPSTAAPATTAAAAPATAAPAAKAKK